MSTWKSRARSTSPGSSSSRAARRRYREGSAPRPPASRASSSCRACSRRSAAGVAPRSRSRATRPQDRLRARHRRPQLRDQHLVVDQLADVFLGLLVRGVRILIEQGCRQRCRRGALPGPRQGGVEVVGRFDGDMMVRPALAVAAHLEIAEPVSGAVEARIDAERQAAADLGLARQRVGQGDQVVHIQAGVPAVVGAVREDQPGLITQRPDRACRRTRPNGVARPAIRAK